MDGRTSAPLIPNQITGAVLSGGGSTRMGKDKALMKLGNHSLLEHAVARLSPFCRERIILSNHPTHDLPGILRYPDAFPDCGPLGGLLTALNNMETEFLLLLAVDLPLISAPLLAHLLSQVTPETRAVVPVVEGALQPVCAVYARSLFPELKAAYEAGTFSLTRILNHTQVQKVPIGGEAYFYFPELFLNVNRPEDWARIQQYGSHED